MRTDGKTSLIPRWTFHTSAGASWFVLQLIAEITAAGWGLERDGLQGAHSRGFGRNVLGFQALLVPVTASGTSWTLQQGARMPQPGRVSARRQLEKNPWRILLPVSSEFGGSRRRSQEVKP